MHSLLTFLKVVGQFDRPVAKKDIDGKIALKPALGLYAVVSSVWAKPWARSLQPRIAAAGNISGEELFEVRWQKQRITYSTKQVAHSSTKGG